MTTDKTEIYDLKEQKKKLLKSLENRNNKVTRLTKENQKLQLESAKQKEIIRIQAEIIDGYKQLADINNAEWWIGGKFVGNI